MGKKVRIVDTNVTINVDEIRAAVMNAARVQEVALEIPVVDPKDLSIDDQIFGLELLPVNPEEKVVRPETSVYTAVKPILVDTLSGRVKPGFITVNGSIDIPKEGGKVVKVEDCYFANKEDARAVCREITEVEMERAIDKAEKIQKTVEFYQKQLADDRF